MLTDTQAQIEFLDAQCADFYQMQGLGRRQRECLLRDDLKGLSDAMSQMQQMMMQVRLRQQDMGPILTSQKDSSPEVTERVERLRHLIESISQVRTQSELAAKQLLGQTHGELEQANQQRRASRGYGQPASVNEPRFTDGLR